jgi:hypothetical protein
MRDGKMRAPRLESTSRALRTKRSFGSARRSPCRTESSSPQERAGRNSYYAFLERMKSEQPGLVELWSNPKSLISMRTFNSSNVNLQFDMNEAHLGDIGFCDINPAWTSQSGPDVEEVIWRAGAKSLIASRMRRESVVATMRYQKRESDWRQKSDAHESRSSNLASLLHARARGMSIMSSCVPNCCRLMQGPDVYQFGLRRMRTGNGNGLSQYQNRGWGGR